jgi:hypothetical protein
VVHFYSAGVELAIEGLAPDHRNKWPIYSMYVLVLEEKNYLETETEKGQHVHIRSEAN